MQPISNRHFTNRRVSFLMFASSLTPLILLCTYGAVTIDARLWFLLAGVITLSVGFYLLEDSLTDKLGWKLFWSRFYVSNDMKSKEHMLIKELETNPGKGSKDKLIHHLKNE